MTLLLAVLAGCSSGSSGTAETDKGPQAVTSLAHTVEKVRTGVVRVETNSCLESGVGTGFLIGPRHVVTVEHVVAEAARIEIKSGGKIVARGTVIGSDAARDLALVTAAEKRPPATGAATVWLRAHRSSTTLNARRPGHRTWLPTGSSRRSVTAAPAAASPLPRADCDRSGHARAPIRVNTGPVHRELTHHGSHRSTPHV